MKISTAIWKYALFVFPAGVFIWLLCVIFQPFEPRHPEPQYQGKKLTEWAREIDRMNFFRLPAYQQHQKQNEQAIAAIRQIGTNALPVALELLRAKDSWLRTKVLGQVQQWIDKYNLDVEDYNLGYSKDQWRSEIHFTFTWADDKRFEGVNIIWALGSMTKPIIPDLIQLLQSRDTEIAEDVMLALPGAGTNAIPPLIELLNNPDKEVRLRAAITLGDFFRPKTPPNESNGLLIVTGGENFRLQARAAVPVLLSYLDSREINLIQRIHVIHALGLIREDAPVVVPILIRHIQSETNRMDEIIRGNYFWALGSFGTNAESAVPVLVNILESMAKSPDNPLSIAPMVALQKINPEAAKPFMEKWKASLTNSANLLPVQSKIKSE